MEYNDVIRSIGYNQHEILYNIMQMHNNGKPFDCDPTYSIGNFYGKFNIAKTNGETTLETREKLAAKVYRHTCTYDNYIATYLENRMAK